MRIARPAVAITIESVSFYCDGVTMFELNHLPEHGQALEADDAAYLDLTAALRVQQLLDLCPASKPTALFALPGLSSEVGIGQLFIKDESTRLGLGSFKALGGAHAVLQVFLEEAARKLDRTVAPEEIINAELQSFARQFTVACATDGNHGRSVAAGARFIGCHAVIFIHSGVSADRAAAIERFGAEIRRVPGVYDDAVAAANRESAANGWTVVSDTSWPGYERIPKLVAQGYTVMLQEALAAMPAAPTHVFVQAGVGGLASAVAGHLSLVCDHAPRIVIVEPERAACLFASHDAGERVVIPHKQSTVMAMLECQEPSLAAWRVIARLASAFMTIGEKDAVRAMRRLAEPTDSDPAIVAGESGGAGLAGLLVATESAATRDALHLDGHSVVLLLNTEGATDPETYERLVGRTPEQVLEKDRTA